LNSDALCLNIMMIKQKTIHANRYEHKTFLSSPSSWFEL